MLIDRYLRDAIEVDVDALCAAPMWSSRACSSISRRPGSDSGDSACSIPPYSLSDKVVAEIERQTKALALALNVKGLMNVQYAVKDETVYLIEVNPRASRTVPFVAKAIGRPVAKIAARVMAGEKLDAFDPISRDIGHIAVKESVFPFARFPGTDPVLGPEMKSTGEVMGINGDFDIAFAKSQLGGGIELPDAGTVFISVKDADKDNIVPAVELLVELGYKIIATGGTAEHLAEKGLPVERVNKVAQGRPHIVDKIKDGEVRQGDLAADAVTSAAIRDGSVQDSDLAASARGGKVLVYSLGGFDFSTTPQFSRTLPTIPGADPAVSGWTIHLVRASGNIYPIPGDGRERHVHLPLRTSRLGRAVPRTSSSPGRRHRRVSLAGRDALALLLRGLPRRQPRG